MHERKRPIRERIHQKIQELKRKHEAKKTLLYLFGSDVDWTLAWTSKTFANFGADNFFYDHTQNQRVSYPKIEIHNDYDVSAVALRDSMLPFTKMEELGKIMTSGDTVKIKFVGDTPLFDIETSATKDESGISVVMKKIAVPPSRRRDVQPTTTPMQIVYTYNEKTGMLTVQPSDYGKFIEKNRKIEAKLAEQNPFPDAGQRADHRSIALSYLHVSYEYGEGKQQSLVWTPQGGKPVATITFHDGHKRIKGLPTARYS